MADAQNHEMTAADYLERALADLNRARQETQSGSIRFSIASNPSTPASRPGGGDARRNRLI